MEAGTDGEDNDENEIDLSSLEAVVEQCSVNKFKDVGNVFLKNLSNIEQLLHLPVELISETQALKVAAQLESDSRKELTKILRQNDWSEEVFDLVMKQSAASFLTQPSGQELLFTEIMRSLKERSEEDPAWNNKMRVLYTSCITQSWGVFEVLARDLWITGLNLFPDLLTDKLVRTRHFEKLSIKFTELKGMHFNVSQCLGDLLVNHENIRFTGCDRIAHSFEVLFDDSFKPIHSFLTSRLTYLFVIEKLRHLLVHKAGIIDNKFISELPAEMNLVRGELYEIHYGYAALAVRAVAHSGEELLKFIDNYVGAEHSPSIEDALDSEGRSMRIAKNGHNTHN